MRRTALLGLAVCIAVSGCANRHHRKPVVAQRPGAAPGTSEVPRDATYGLVRPAQPNCPPLVTVWLIRGEGVGFRKESDGSVVAVAGAQTFALGDGEFAWVVVDASPAWRKRAVEDCREFCECATNALLLGGFALGAVGLGVLYLAGQSPTGFVR